MKLQLSQQTLICSKSTIETLEKICEICSILTVKKSEHHLLRAFWEEFLVGNLQVSNSAPENILLGAPDEELFHFKLRIYHIEWNKTTINRSFFFLKQVLAFTCYCTNFLEIYPQYPIKCISGRNNHNDIYSHFKTAELCQRSVLALGETSWKNVYLELCKKYWKKYSILKNKYFRFVLE